MRGLHYLILVNRRFGMKGKSLGRVSSHTNLSAITSVITLLTSARRQVPLAFFTSQAHFLKRDILPPAERLFFH